MGPPTEEVAVPAIDQADEHLSRQPLPAEPPNIDGEDEPPQGSSNRTVRMDLRQLDDGDSDHGQAASVPGLRWAISIVRGIKR